MDSPSSVDEPLNLGLLLNIIYRGKKKKRENGGSLHSLGRTTSLRHDSTGLRSCTFGLKLFPLLSLSFSPSLSLLSPFSSLPYLQHNLHSIYISALWSHHLLPMRQIATRVALTAASFAVSVLAHGGDASTDMNMDMDMGMNKSQPTAPAHPNSEGPMSYFAYDKHRSIILAHIGLMVAAWCFTLPIGTRGTPRESTLGRMKTN